MSHCAFLFPVPDGRFLALDGSSNLILLPGQIRTTTAYCRN
jgi:hypothetical protein